MSTVKSLLILLLGVVTISANGQLKYSPETISTDYSLSESEQTPGNEFLVNTRLFEFDSSSLNPWIEEITHLRVFGVDFSKPKNSEGMYQYVDESRLNDFIDFCKKKNLKVIWTLSVSSFTLDEEMAYVKSAIDKGLNVVAFEYGGEFYLKKYIFGDMKAKGVVERIRMDGEYRDYLNLLDMWLPAMTKVYPYGEYEHILITASVSGEKNRVSNYRREFNRKVFSYVKSKPELKGKVSFSYHIYAGAKPATYNKDEEEVVMPDQVDWSFLNEKPEGSRWVVTESGYYVKDFSKNQLDQAREFYTKQAQKLDNKSLMGIHTLLNPSSRSNPLALYDRSGLTPVGEMVNSWLKNKESSSSDSTTQNDETTSSGTTDGSASSTNSGDKNPELVKIYPEYSGFLQWIHFNHTLVFSNGKSYKRSYWFSSPDFSKADIGKPLSYFKKVLKGK